jgi:trimeric autotransporter adhesin
MKTIYTLLLVLFFSPEAFTQVDVTSSGGTSNASYTTVKAAFDQLNLGTHTGIITISISANTTETASAVLNASGTGAASYTSIAISPAGGAARSISGDIAGPLVDLNGADNVTIDGLNTGGNSLTLTNTNTGSSAATIRLIQDATNNVVTRCNIRGSSGAAGTTGVGNGVIYFAYGTAPAIGNDNNTISNNTIGPAGTNLPLNGIYSLGPVGGVVTSDNNSIINNAIFDYFNPYESSCGIYLLSSIESWTVTGNNFYQTATRTPINGRTHYAISILSGSGHTINNNFIGGSSPSALGTAYTFAGTAATRFTGIRVLAGTAAVTNIQGNTIANMSFSTSSGFNAQSGIWCGIDIAAGNVNAGTTAANIIGATSGTDNIRVVSTTTGGQMSAIHYGSTSTIAIQNNIIGSLSLTGATAAVGGHLAGILVTDQTASLTLSGNIIGNTTADNMRCGNNGSSTGISSVSGINLTTVAFGTVAITGNTIRNLSAYGTGSGFVRGIWTTTSTASTAVYSITGNTISVLTTNATLSDIASGQAAALGINITTGTNNLISQNTIHTISNTNATTTGNYVAAITIALATSTTISRNRIYNITNAGTSISATAPSIAAGIVVRSGTTAVNIHNNMISLGNAQSTNTAFIGIQCNNGGTPDPVSRIYYNSIHIEGTVLTGSQPSFGIARTDFSTTARTAPVNIRNNLINNTRSGGFGSHYAISNNYGASTASAVGWGVSASNYNLLNANAATVGNWGSSSNFSFTGWKSVSAGDGNALSAKPVTFAAPVTGNLRLNFGTTPTSIESAGILIAGLTNDFDNDSRPGPAGSVNGAAFAPDLGADEFDGVYLDIIPPVITYTPLGFTCDAGNRTLVATITDFSGLPISGAGLPRLYWKINSGAYTGVTATRLGGNQYQFVFGAGVSAGNIVSYYIVAQDNYSTPNITVSPSAGAAGLTANPPAAATPPTSPVAYNVYPVLPAGTYTIGATGNYTTVTAAINAYNNSCLAGPVVFEILDGTLYEPAGWTISKHPFASAVNTLTIRPAAGASPYIGGNVAGGPSLKILGSNVTIDGSNNGTKSRDLYIGNSSTNAPITIVIGSSGTSPITNVTIKNCNINTSALVNPAVVVSDGAVYGDSGYFNNINFTNNRVSNANSAFYISAVTIPANGSGLIINDNLMNVSTFSALKKEGIYIEGVDGAMVSGNNIGNFDPANTENDLGIWLSNCSNTAIVNNIISNLGYTSTGVAAPTGIRVEANIPVNGIVISGNTISGLNSNSGGVGISTNGIHIVNAVTGVSISQNKIINISNSSTAGWGAHGILLSSTSTAANITLANNFIANVAGYGYPSASVDDNGHGISVNTGAGYNIFHNTVNLSTNQTAAGGFPAAFFVSSAVTVPGAINLRSNIFCNRQTGGSTERYAINSRAASSVFASIDYNDYYTAGLNLGYIGVNRSNLAAVQAGFGGNINALNILPVFVSNTDLHLYTNENSGIDNKGTPVGTVVLDIDNNIRNAVTPDMGASEFTFLGFCPSVNVNFVSNISGSTYQWQVDNGSGYVNIIDGGVYGGSATATLTLINPPTSYAKNKYRCLVDGASLSSISIYKVGVNWTGASSTDWTDTGNWSCGTVPDQYTDVQINPGVPNYPLVNTNITLRSLLVQPGATVNVGAGVLITLVGN